MSIETIVAVLMVIAGGALMGSFLLPTRATRLWPWECYWFVFSLVGTLLCPWILAMSTNSDLAGTLSSPSTGALAKTFLFGALWGVGGCLFGIGVEMVGMALGFAIIIGLTAAIGALLPIVVRQPDKFFEPVGLWTLAGMLVLLVGVAILSLAGKRRDEHRKGLQETSDAPAPRGIPPGRFAAGLLVCVVSGTFSAMLNIAFVFADQIKDAATQAGTPLSSAGDVVWAVTLSGGFLANIGLSTYKLTRNRTWKLLLAVPVHYWPLGVLVGVLWYAGPALFGRGQVRMGELGGSVGWGIFMASLILTSNLWGLALGEWKNSGSRARKFLAAGLLVLFCGIALLARAAHSDG